MSKKIVLHPYLFVIYPILLIYVSNTSLVDIHHLPRPIMIGLVFAFFLMLTFFYLFKSWSKAGAFVSLLIFVFFTYGHIVSGSLIVKIGPIAIYDFHLMLVSSVVLLLILYRKIRQHKGQFIRLTAALNLITFLLLVQTIYSLVVSFGDPFDFFNENLAKTYSVDDTTKDLPDIYFLVLDAYAREDVLNEIFDFDNTKFYDELVKRGFYIANKSYSSYSQTHLSISSSLNMAHVDFIQDTPYVKTKNRAPLVYAVNNSNFVNLVNSLGYESVLFDSPFLAISSAESNFTQFISSSVPLSYFEAVLLDKSLVSGFFGKHYFQRYLYRQKTLDAFNNFEQVHSIDSPKFVYAHYLIPHPPYNFDVEGNDPYIGKRWEFALEPSHKDTTYKEARSLYVDQLQYANTRALELVDQILQNSETPPVIILQADHGPFLLSQFLEEDDVKKIVKERMGVLNAVYLPNGYQSLNPGISQLNTFVAVSNEYLGTQIDPVEEKTYYSSWQEPYFFWDVTEGVRKLIE